MIVNTTTGHPGLTHEHVTIGIALPEADLKHIDEFVT